MRSRRWRIVATLAACAAAGVGLLAQSTWSMNVERGRAAAPVELLHATWCPKKLVPIANVPASQPLGDDADNERVRPAAPDRARGARAARSNEIGRIGRLPPDLRKAPPWSLRFEPNVESAGYDPMLAVGNKYLIVTQDHEIGFFDRSGKPLSPTTCVPKKLSSTAFFSAFWVPTNADGSVNQSNINLQLGFPRNAPQTCDATKPSPSPPCVNEFYDTRVIFDRVHKRFVIAAAARNGLWKGTTDPEALVRRYAAFAVSKTEDPRDGFHQYMTVATNYADFPRVLANGGSLVIAHNKHDPGKPSAYVFDFDDLAAGKAQPASFTYDELQTGGRVVPVTDFTGTSPYTLFVTLAKANPKTLEIFAMPTVVSYSSPPPLLKTSVDLAVKPSSWSLGPVVRAGKVYLVSSVTISPRVPDVRPGRLSVRMIRVPVEVSGSTLTASSSPAKGYLDRFFGLRSADDAPTDLVSYEVPGIAVNSSETIAFVYGRVGVETAKPLFPETRYSFWYKGEAKQRGSKLLQKGEFQPTRIWVGETQQTAETFECEGCGKFAHRVEYSTAVVDPIDDKTFWVIHEFADKDTNGWRTVVGKVKP
jgi:hypothetical protein